MSQRSSWGSNTPARRKGYRRLRYWADTHDGTGYRRRTETIKGSKRDGDRRLAELRLEHWDDRPSVTVGDFWRDSYLPDVSSTLAPGTLKNYRSAWTGTIEPRWGDVPLADVRPMDMQDWLLGLSKGRAENAMRVLSGIFTMAVKFEAVDRNPMRVGYRMPERTMRKRDRSVMSLSEMVDVLRGPMRGSPIECAYALAAFGSCRVGESLGPMLSDAEMRPASNGVPVLRVRIARQIGDYGEVYDRMKTETSERTVMLPGAVAERIWSVVLERRDDGLTWMTDTGLGEPMGKKALRRTWSRALSAAGMSEVPFMNLRNSWRTAMKWELHMDPSMLERMMGHVGANIGERVYDRPFDDMVANALAEACERTGLLLKI